jgi:hypothetical protein
MNCAGFSVRIFKIFSPLQIEKKNGDFLTEYTTSLCKNGGLKKKLFLYENWQKLP